MVPLQLLITVFLASLIFQLRFIDNVNSISYLNTVSSFVPRSDMETSIQTNVISKTSKSLLFILARLAFTVIINTHFPLFLQACKGKYWLMKNTGTNGMAILRTRVQLHSKAGTYLLHVKFKYCK